MKRFMMAWLVLSASLLAVGTATPDSAAPATNAPAAKKPAKKFDLFGDEVVAKGNGFEIKRGSLDEEVIRLKAQAASRNQPIPPEQAQLMEQRILDQMIRLELLKVRATEPDRIAGAALAQKRIDEVKKQLRNENSFNLRLKAEGLTNEELVEKWTEAATVEEVARREL
jgi:hypothetical protein